MNDDQRTDANAYIQYMRPDLPTFDSYPAHEDLAEGRRLERIYRVFANCLAFLVLPLVNPNPKKRTVDTSKRDSQTTQTRLNLGK